MIGISEIYHIIQSRRSIREFSSEIPDETKIMKVIEAALWAPSPANMQPWKFLVVKNSDIKDKIVKAVISKIEENRKSFTKISSVKEYYSTYQPYYLSFKEAPVIIAVLYKSYPSHLICGEQSAKSDSIGKLISAQSVGAAIQNMLLTMTSEGLGGCWMTGPLIAKKQIENILEIDYPWELLALVSLGFPRRVPDAPRRKSIRLVVKII